MNAEMGVKAFEMKLDAELEMARARMEQLASKLKADAAQVDRP